MSVNLTDDQIRERALWARRLLHGGLPQSTGALRVREADGTIGYCCLGVYKEMIAPGHRDLAFTEELVDGFRYQSNSGTLTDEDCERLGFSDVDQEAAAEMNDDDHATFGEIAYAIAWSTVHKVPFRHMRDWWRDDIAGEEEHVDGLRVPDDFDIEAWLTEVLG